MRMQFLNVNNVRTRIALAGDAGPVLLLIHGFGGLIEHWYRNIDALGMDFRVIAVDLLGHGFTDPIALHGQPPHPSMVAHLGAIVDQLGLTRFTVCGSSFGSLLSCLLYLAMPKSIEKLVLCGSGSVFNTDDELAAALPQVLANARTALADATLSNCLRRLGTTNFDPKSAPEPAALVQSISLALPGVKEFYIEAMSGMMSEPARSFRVLHRLRELTVPTLVIWGREDPRGHHARAVEYVPQLPDASLITFERCGHKPFMEYPDLFHSAVREFILGAGQGTPH